MIKFLVLFPFYFMIFVFKFMFLPITMIFKMFGIGRRSNDLKAIDKLAVALMAWDDAGRF